ncbi:hypothetical protein D0U04_27625 [Bacillus clarus]|uniref:Uncharacterized protein n=1 Tax=Bacillus clarus TaxID=2338372 RepID=A0ABX9KNG1_9BACI|nr:hypothetical protein D0U04_27625 [Bacillus clarus]
MGNGTNSDFRYSQKRTQTLNPGDFSLWDLGCFSKYDLEAITEQKAFYVSRILRNTQIYHKEGLYRTLLFFT